MVLHAHLLLCRELDAQYKALVLEQKALTDEEFWSSNVMLKVAGVAGTRMVTCRVRWAMPLGCRNLAAMVSTAHYCCLLSLVHVSQCTLCWLLSAC
jgi:hypothetical protein